MKIIIPMAGMGKRMRPHTLTVPKPLLPIAGKPIVHRLVEDLSNMVNEKLEEINFIISPEFGEQVENDLKAIAEKTGAKGIISYQEEPLGTAHAIVAAGDSLDGHVIVAFADTLFYADFSLNTEADGTIWTSRIDDPSQFGVVETDEQGIVKKFWEKPKEFVSDQAIIGIYYFKDGAYLRRHLQYLLDNDIKVKGEYQLTDALERMTSEGTRFNTATVTHWLDCGNKDATVATMKVVLDKSSDSLKVPQDVKLENSVVIQPSFIGKGAMIVNSVIGPYAAIEANTHIENSIVSNSMVYESSHIRNASLDHSMVGKHVHYHGRAERLSLGDYSKVE